LIAPCSQASPGQTARELAVGDTLRGVRIMGVSMPATSSAPPCHHRLIATWCSVRCAWPPICGGRPEGSATIPYAAASSASRDYRQALQSADIVCSMKRKGNCWDNAPAESFCATLKVERRRHFGFNTRDTDLRYICWCDTHRRHSTRGLLSGATFKVQTGTATCAARGCTLARFWTLPLLRCESHRILTVSKRSIRQPDGQQESRVIPELDGSRT
jgi:hypothetical protein